MSTAVVRKHGRPLNRSGGTKSPKDRFTLGPFVVRNVAKSFARTIVEHHADHIRIETISDGESWFVLQVVSNAKTMKAFHASMTIIGTRTMASVPSFI